MKTYRISEANLTAPKGIVIILNFGEKGRHEVLLEEAAAYLRSSQGLVGIMPVGVTLPDERKVGAFPCIIAKTPLAAEAMSHMLGYEIAVGDGVRCATQLQARERATTLHRRYGIPTKNMECLWMVSPPMEAQAKLEPKPKAEPDFSDSPF
jgi:hypothetical protein